MRHQVFNSTPPGMKSRSYYYMKLIRLDRPIGIMLLMWPALWALWIAGNGSPPVKIMFIFLLGVALMRSAGCAINDYADRHFDGEVARTRDRPVASGDISPNEALGVFAILVIAAFLLVLLLSWHTILLSFVALALAVSYPFMKRYTHLPQLVLGMAFGWAVPMVFMAVTDSIPTNAWLLYIATVIWALIYDTEYAMVDREDDLKIGVKSTAILFGKHDRTMIGLLQVSMLGLMVLIGFKFDFGNFYYFSLAVGGLLFLHQQHLMKERHPEDCFDAFMNNNRFGMVIFVGLVLDYLVRA